MQVKEIGRNSPPTQSKEEIQRIFDEAKRKVKAPIQAESVEPRLSSVDGGSTILVTDDVPSKMLPYPTGSQIKYKPFTYGELQKFNSSKLTEVEALKFILDGIITIGFEKSNLAYVDFLFIALLRKITATNKSKFRYKFVCDDCGHEEDQEGFLSDIEFKDLDIPSLPIIVDVEPGISLYVNPITIGSFIKLREKDNDNNLVTYSECVINMSSEQAFKIINSAQDDLIYVLEEADRMLGFGEQHIDCKCSKCNTVNSFQLEDIQYLVHPFRPSGDSVKARIRFS